MRTTILIVVCAFAVVVASFAIRNPRRVERTPARAVRDRENPFDTMLTVGGVLADHYSQHRSYPHSLSELPAKAWPWPGASSSPTNLAFWHYTSQGQTFTMTMTGAFGHESFLGGRSGQIFYRREDMEMPMPNLAP